MPLGSISPSSGGSGNGRTLLWPEVTQEAHGFTMLQPLFAGATGWEAAQADDAATAQVRGLAYPTGDDTFQIITDGYVAAADVTAAGLDPEKRYFLDPATSGLTDVAPTDEAHYFVEVLTTDADGNGLVKIGEVVSLAKIDPDDIDLEALELALGLDALIDAQVDAAVAAALETQLASGTPLTGQFVGWNGTGRAWAYPPAGAGDPPATPLEPTLVSKTTTTISVEVVEVEEATGYRWYIDDVETTLTEDPAYEFTGLTAGTEYDITVKAVNASGESAASPAFVVSTDAAFAYLVNQGFEGVGYDNGETPTTYGDGTVDPDYTAVVLAGLRSCRITVNTGQTETGLYWTFAGQNEVWGKFLYRPTSTPGGTRVFLRIRDSGGTELMRLETTNAHLLRLTTNTNNPVTDPMAVNVTHTIHFRYALGSGANGFAEACWSTDGSKPTSGDQYISDADHTRTAQAARLDILASGSALNPIFDTVQLAALELP